MSQFTSDKIQYVNLSMSNRCHRCRAGGGGQMGMSRTIYITSSWIDAIFLKSEVNDNDSWD